jgi:hypothetical protein
MCVVAVSIAGCSNLPSVPDIVRVPVPVPCLDSAPVRPALLSDAELLALDDFELIVSLAKDRRQRQGYEATLEAAVAGCAVIR